MTARDRQTFQVVCSGQPRAGFERAAVAAALSCLKMASAQVEQLLDGRRRVIKRTDDIALANSYRQRLWAAGLAVDVVAPADDIDTENPPADEAPIAATPDTHPSITPLPTALSAAARAADRHLALHWLLAALAVGAVPAALLMVLAISAGLLLHHAVVHAIWLQIPPWWWSGLLYLLPLLAGCSLLLLLLRPLLPKPRDAAQTSITSDAALEALLADAADACGLPRPAMLRIDAGNRCEVTLLPGRAGWRHGATAMTVGLALLRQPPAMRRATLAAALVQTLPLSARLRHLAERCERWLAANIEPRDSWQAWLDRRAAAEQPPRWLAPLQLLERGYRRPASRLFTALLGYARARLLPARRAQLLISDRFAAMVVGPAQFDSWRRTERRWQWATDWAQQFALEHPVENLPALIAHAAQQPSAELEAELTRELASSPPPGEPWPGERSRRQQIEALTLTAVTDEAATTAVAEALEVAATDACYRALGIDTGARLPTEQTEQLVALLREREQAAARYFNGWLHTERGWRLPEAALIDALPLTDATEQLHVCVNEIRRLTPDRAALLASRDRLQRQLAELRLGAELLSLRQPFTFRLNPGIEPAALPHLIAAKQAELDKQHEQLALQESIMGGRLALGLRLSGQAGDEIGALRDGLAFFTELLERVARLEGDAALLDGLLRRPLPTAAQPVLQRLRERMAEATGRLLRRLEQAPPFPERHTEPAAQRAQRRLSSEVGERAIAARASTLCAICRDLHVELSQLAADWASGAEESYGIETIRRADL
jgi:hypothetical protein